MMKKTSKPPMEASMVSPATYVMSAVGDDARARLKLQNLMQDYEELSKDTAAKRRRLQMGKQKLLRLTDEVRFLRRRYKHITEKTLHTSYQVKAQPQKAAGAPKHKARKSPAVSTGTQIQEHLSQHDSNHREEAAARSTSTILDLNEISLLSVEEEELQVAWEPLPMERLSTRYHSEVHVPGGNLKLSVDRDVRRGTSRLGKRKISRQDQNGRGGEFHVASEPLPMGRSLIRYPSQGNMPGGEIKLSVCRDVGSGGSRAGKRKKILWLDQVALKV